MAKEVEPTYEELKRELAETKRKLEEQRNLAAQLKSALTAIGRESDLMRLEAYKYVVDTDDPVWLHISRQITKFAALAARMAAKLARHDPARRKTERMQPEDSDANNNGNTGNGEAETKEKPKRGKARRPAQDLAEAGELLKQIEAENPLEEPYARSIKDNSSTATSDKVASETHRGRRNNYGEIRNLGKPDENHETDQTVPCECPMCRQKDLELLEEIGIAQEKLKKLQGELAKPKGGFVQIDSHAYYCHNCKRPFVHRPEGGDHAICPGRSISCQSLLEVMYGQHHGVSITTAGKDFEKGAGLGSDTISRNIHDLDVYYFWGLYLALLALLKQEEVIGADETPFRIVSALATKCYILSIGTPERALNRIELYKFLPNRTALAIAWALADFQFKVLITDAFAGYNKTMEEHPTAKRQSCLVHFRREMINGVWETQLARDFFALSDEDRKKFLLEERSRKGTFYIQLLVFRAISEIYKLEREIASSPPGEIKEIRRKQKNQFDTIDKIMEELSAGRVVKEKSGRYRRAENSDPLAGACVYWHNNKEQLGTFLDDNSPVQTSPDNSVMERNIRPLAIVRNNSKFWISQDYARATLGRMSVFRTLEVNGIDVMPWVCKFCGAVYDHISSKMMAYYYEDYGVKSAKVTIKAEAKPGKEDTLPENQRKYRLSELVSDFDFAKWAREIVETGRLNRAKAKESNPAAV